MEKDEHYKDLLTKVKLLLPNSNNNPNYDQIIDFSLEKIMNDVANYVHFLVAEIPAELDTVMISMTVQLLDTHGWLNGQQDDSNVGSITEGDVSVTFKQPSEVYQDLQTINEISDDYRLILNNFRRLPEQ